MFGVPIVVLIIGVPANRPFILKPWLVVIRILESRLIVVLCFEAVANRRPHLLAPWLIAAHILRSRLIVP